MDWDVSKIRRMLLICCMEKELLTASMKLDVPLPLYTFSGPQKGQARYQGQWIRKELCGFENTVRDGLGVVIYLQI